MRKKMLICEIVHIRCVRSPLSFSLCIIIIIFGLEPAAATARFVCYFLLLLGDWLIWPTESDNEGMYTHSNVECVLCHACLSS